ncbi:MAG: class I SAM-dependent methyltransferase [Bacteroidota bacterium]
MFESPITGKKSAIVNQFLAKDIINGYRTQLGVDVEKFFDGIRIVYLCKCPDSGLMFFYPRNIVGDGEFYKSLSKFDWYYIESKWEHQVAYDWITPGSKVLELGCGKGYFLKRITQKSCLAVGLEINEQCNETGDNFKILNQTIEQHSLVKPEFYDYVCGFQLFEHLPNLKDSIISSLKVLKKHGKIIISVPNQDSFISLDKFNLLDLPPHHQTRWTPDVFYSFEKIFNLKLIELKFEPLQNYHKDYFLSLINQYYNNPFVFEYFKEIVDKYPDKIKGHTMIAIFQKIS